MSKAAVHLPIDPQTRTPEFYVAAFFVLLTAAVMSLFFLIIVLELLGVVVRRSNPDDHRRTHLAKLMQQDPEGRKLLQRMTVHQRIQHWLLAVTFIVLVYTGMCIKFADMSFSRTLVNIVGGVSMARLLHRISGVTTGPGYRREQPSRDYPHRQHHQRRHHRRHAERNHMSRCPHDQERNQPHRHHHQR